MSISVNGNSFASGDTVQQIAQFGLTMHPGFLFVRQVKDGELVLAESANGQVLTDLKGLPMYFPAQKFRKIPK